MAMEIRPKTIMITIVIMLVMTNCFAGRSKSDRKDRRGRGGQLVSNSNYVKHLASTCHEYSVNILCVPKEMFSEGLP